MERHVMTVMCVISRVLYTTQHCGCGFLFYLIREAQLAAGSTMAPPPCSHNLLSQRAVRQQPFRVLCLRTSYTRIRVMLKFERIEYM